MNAGIESGRASEAQVLAARDMFEGVFGSSASPEAWRRKYFGNPAGEVAAFAAEDEGRLVGFLGLHPSAFYLEGARVTVYQAGDVMTDPAYRRRGILTALKTLGAEWMRDRGVPFTISFPVAAVYESHLKTGYTVVGRMRRWVKPLAPSSLSGGAFSLLSSALEIKEDFLPAEPLTAYDGRIDEVGEEAGRRWKYAGARGAEFLAWRFPLGGQMAAWITPKGGASGYAVAERTARGVWIRDLVAAEALPATVGSLLAAVAAHARECGAEHVVFPYLGVDYRKPLLQAGYLPVPGGAPFLIKEISRPFGEKLRLGDWLVTDADRDLDCLEAAPP